MSGKVEFYSTWWSVLLDRDDDGVLNGDAQKSLKKKVKKYIM